MNELMVLTGVVFVGVGLIYLYQHKYAGRHTARSNFLSIGGITELALITLGLIDIILGFFFF